jgi:hypothetical protein
MTLSTSLHAPSSPDGPQPAGLDVTLRTGAAALAAALAAASDRWLTLVRFSPTSRWTHLLPAEAAAAVLPPGLHEDLSGAQVWLLSWLPQQGTPLHDHGDSAGAFAVVRGALTERVVAAGRPGSGVRQSASELTGGRIRHFGPHYVHQVTNVGTEPAVSVHVYAPELRRMNTYAVDADALVRTGTEKAGVNW